MDDHLAMASDTTDNDIIFDVLIRASDSCKSIENKLNELDQTSHMINDQFLTNMLENSSELTSDITSHTCLRGDEYKKLVEQSKLLESIVYLPTRLAGLINNPDKVDEAIELIEYAKKIHIKYSEHIPIIDIIGKKTETLQEYLIDILCNRLDDLKDCDVDVFKYLINQLIRCSNFSDRDLRLRFLQARDNWFNNECEAKSESFDDIITFFCKGLPKVFEEYRHIFGDNCNYTDRNFVHSSTISNSEKEDGAIINSWLLLKTSTFILSLEVHLKSISRTEYLTPTMIGDTVQKCFKLTDWLSSTGFDFSAQLVPLFSQAIVEEVRYSAEQATRKFETEFTKIVSKSIESLLLPVEDEILRISNMKPEEQVPKSICHYPVFKIYCLYLIESLRWIQTTKNIMSPISLCLEIYAVLNSSLTRVIKALAAVLNMDNNSSHPILSKIAISFLTEILPFITNYCELLFPERVILGAIGMSKSEFKTIYMEEPEKLKNFRLDLKQIAEPLRVIMPALMQVIES